MKVAAIVAAGMSDLPLRCRDAAVEDQAALTAKKTALEAEIDALKTEEQNADNVSALQAKQAELQAVVAKEEALVMKARNNELETALIAQREKDAEAAVKAAVKRGAIPTQDSKLQASWKKKCVEDPESIELLASMKGSPAMERQRLILPHGQVQVVRESSLNVLNAFGAERDPLKRAALYAKEIKARYLEGDEMPLMAANNPGTLSGTLVTQRTLELLKLTFPALGSISTDFSDEQVKYGQTVQSRIVTIPAVQTYDVDTGWADSDAVMTDVPVTINRQKGVPITLNSQTLGSTARQLFDEVAPAQAYALAKEMMDFVYSLITAANFTEAAINAALIDFGRPTVIDIGVAQDVNGVPDGPMNRSLLLNGQYFGQLKKDTAIVTLAAHQKAEIIEQGVLPDVEGYKVIKAVNLPVAENLKGFALSKSALVLSTRLDNDYTQALPGASNGSVQVVTNPDLGISVMQVQYVNHQRATATQRISFMYGAAKGQIKSGQRLTG